MCLQIQVSGSPTPRLSLLAHLIARSLASLQSDKLQIGTVIQVAVKYLGITPSQ